MCLSVALAHGSDKVQQIATNVFPIPGEPGEGFGAYSGNAAGLGYPPYPGGNYPPPPDQFGRYPGGGMHRGGPYEGPYPGGYHHGQGPDSMGPPNHMRGGPP